MSWSRNRNGVIFLHSSDELYGADRMLIRFIESLPATVRADVQVWLPTDIPGGPHLLCQELIYRGIRVEHINLPVLRRSYLNPLGLLLLASRSLHTRRLLRDSRPRLVVLATSALLPVAPISPASARIVLHLQEIWHGVESKILSLLARRTRLIIAISAAAKASVSPGLQGRTVVVPNGTEDAPIGETVDQHTGPLVFLIASRWNSWKGHDVLLRAWRLAGEPGRLRILGGPPPVGAATDVPALVEAYGCTESVEIVGEVDDIDQEIVAADAMIVPSTQPEPFGLTSIEAFARGRPVIGTNAGGLSDIVQEGAGWLVPPDDPDALAALLRNLSRAELAQAGQLARERFEKHYTLEIFRHRMRREIGSLS